MINSNTINHHHHRNTTSSSQQQQQQPRQTSSSSSIRCLLLQVRRIINQISGGSGRRQPKLWTFIGICFYIMIWFVAISDESKTYNQILTFNQEKEINYKKWEAKQLEMKRIMIEKQKQQRLEQRSNNNNKGRLRGITKNIANDNFEVGDSSSSSSSQHDSNNSNSSSNQKQQGNNPNDDDIPPIFGLWASMMILLSYYRIRMEPRLRRRQQMMFQQQQQQQTGQRRRSPPLSQNEQQEAVARTLRRINQERIARGQDTISLESYQAFQHLLMTDRSIWRVLATTRPQQQQQQQRPAGATSEELDLCPIHTIPENSGTGGQQHSSSVDNSSNDNNTTICSICLTSYQPTERIRTLLPCGHTFHQNCIDRWLQQSILCPICKTSIAINNNSNANANDAATISNGRRQRQRQQQRSTSDILDDAIMIGSSM